MQSIKRLSIVLLIIISCVGCDRVTKRMATRTLHGAPPLSYMWDCFRLQYAENQGAFLSLGSRLSDNLRRWILIVIPGVFLFGMLIFAMVSHNLRLNGVIALSLILGGGMGNLFDRIFYDGRVIDFMNIGIGPVRTGIFNVADVWLMVGTAAMIGIGIHDVVKAGKPTISI